MKEDVENGLIFVTEDEKESRRRYTTTPKTFESFMVCESFWKRSEKDVRHLSFGFLREFFCAGVLVRVLGSEGFSCSRYHQRFFEPPTCNCEALFWSLTRRFTFHPEDKRDKSNAYKVLGLQPTATTAQIKRAYRDLSLKWYITSSPLLPGLVRPLNNIQLALLVPSLLLLYLVSWDADPSQASR